MFALGPLNVVVDYLYAYDLWGAAAIIVGALIVSWLTNLILRELAHHFAAKTNTTLDDELVKALRRPIFLAILLVGTYVAAGTIHSLAQYQPRIDKIAVVIGILVIFYGIMRVVNGLFRWYGCEIAKRTQTDFDDKYLGIFKRIIDIFLMILAALVVLRYMGIEITPLLAGLGIGGLAVALALQDTLANFFAGFYILTDKSIKVGDYIELDNGMGGHVEDISWRTTRVKTAQDNYVIIPNNKLSQSITTNYYFGVQEMSITIPMEVAYDSDLDKVERLTLAVAKEVMREVDGAVKTHEPTVRFKEFAESNIKFNVILRVKKFSKQYIVKHEFIKRIKKVYDKNRIEIAYPSRNIYMRK